MNHITNPENPSNMYFTSPNEIDILNLKTEFEFWNNVINYIKNWTTILEYEIVILTCPLLIFIWLNFFRYYIGILGAKILIGISQVLMLILSIFLVIFQIKEQKTSQYILNEIMSLDYLHINLGFTYDSLSLLQQW